GQRQAGIASHFGSVRRAAEEEMGSLPERRERAPATHSNPSSSSATASTVTDKLPSTHDPPPERQGPVADPAAPAYARVRHFDAASGRPRARHGGSACPATHVA